jgi:hypothetical protein
MRAHIIFGALLVTLAATASNAAENDGLPNGNVVAVAMAARDAHRQTLAAGYHGMRRYVLNNEHMHKHAEIVVWVECGADGTKHFELVSQEGWKGAYKHVVGKMLETEAATSHPESRIKTRFSPENYDFHIVGSAPLDDRMAYVIEIIPKRHDLHLIKGHIWVDAEDYAVARIEGEPAASPSFWIRSVHFVHTYQKSGPLWFPASTRSDTEVSFFGATTVTINYFDYSPNLSSQATASAQRPGGLTP